MIWAQWVLLCLVCFFAILLAIKCAIEPKSHEFVAFMLWCTLAVLTYLAHGFAGIIGAP